jgi:hypothetical protein
VAIEKDHGKNLFDAKSPLDASSIEMGWSLPVAKSTFPLKIAETTNPDSKYRQIF